MDNLKNKLGKTILLSVIFLAVLLSLLMTAERILFIRDITGDGLAKAESIRRTLDEYYSRSNDLRDWFYTKVKDDTRMMAFILKDRIVDSEFTGIKKFF